MSESYAVSEKRELLLDKVKKFILDNGGIVKKSQLAGLGIDYRRILDFVEKGDILRVKSGYYAVHLSDFTEEELVAKLFPDCVLNLENALYAYGYIKKKPYGWRLAVDKNTSKSRFKMDYPKIIPMYAEPETLELGVTEIQFSDVTVRIFEKERLICECLKYEDKMDRGRIVKKFSCGAISAEEDVGTSLTSKRDAMLTQAVVAPVDQFDSVYDKGMADYLASGGQNIIDERREKLEAIYGVHVD